MWCRGSSHQTGKASRNLSYGRRKKIWKYQYWSKEEAWDSQEPSTLSGGFQIHWERSEGQDGQWWREQQWWGKRWLLIPQQSVCDKEQANWYQGSNVGKPSLYWAKRPSHEFQHLWTLQKWMQGGQSMMTRERQNELHFTCGSTEATKKDNMEAGLPEASLCPDAILGRR